jgi:hypothetical protein
VPRRNTRAIRLDHAEVAWTREHRLKDIRMWAMLRQIGFYVMFLTALFIFTYSNVAMHSFEQGRHLRRFFLQPNRAQISFEHVNTIDDYWHWLNDSFLSNIRAHAWYNNHPPRNLSGYLNDKTTRLIGWPILRQLRVQTRPCVTNNSHHPCSDEYSFMNEEKQHFSSTCNSTSSPTNLSRNLQRAFQYQTGDQLTTHVYFAPHHSYAAGGYVYEFRGRLAELHRLRWIDRQTRAVFIQITLYHPNVELFTSVILLAELLPTGGIFMHHRFDPLSFVGQFDHVRLRPHSCRSCRSCVL